ncbi:hypothetical protein ACIBCN_35890 [Nocardia sp. NPDC051052]|uniref:hypothetical protein n=1 Tax=Nocardia sp. NPDC051052 TaxID=3364322 RepID=UPI0037BA9E6C
MTPVPSIQALPRSIRTFVTAATIAPFIVAALHAVPDDQVSSPAGDTAQCARGEVCGPINYAPQSGQGAEMVTPVGIKGVFKKKPSYLMA